MKGRRRRKCRRRRLGRKVGAKQRMGMKGEPGREKRKKVSGRMREEGEETRRVEFRSFSETKRSREKNSLLTVIGTTAADNELSNNGIHTLLGTLALRKSKTITLDFPLLTHPTNHKLDATLMATTCPSRSTQAAS